MKNFLKHSPLYFFLLSIYPVIFLFANNIKEIDPILLIRPLLLFVLLGSLLFLVFLAIVRKVQRSAFYALIVLLFFFLVFFILYAPIYQGLRNIDNVGPLLGRHRILIPCVIGLVVLLGALLVWLGKKIPRKFLDSISVFLNLSALILLLFSLINISIGIFQNIRKNSENLEVLPVDELTVGKAAILPDVYYIILDMHTNDNVLSKLFEYDDSAFTQELTNLGFFLSPCSDSNYDDTALSLSSSLNLEYVQDFDPSIDAPTALRNNRVSRMLEEIGYSTYAFETGYSVTELTNFDHYYANNKSVISLLTYPGLTSLESLILRVSAGQLLYEYRDSLSYDMQVFIDAPFVERRETILNVFDTLPEIASEQGPKFVFAHMIAPHHPFVFDQNGDPTFRRTPFSDFDDTEYGKGYGWEPYRDAYVDEIIYLHKRVLDVVDQIMAKSETPPIIIIQGDHGVPATRGNNAQFQILNAYYFPNSEYTGLYGTISPVNSFRVLFNTFFGTSYALLPDRSYIQQEKLYLAEDQFQCP